MKTVQRHLGALGDACILEVTCGSTPVGYLPLSVEGRTAYFLGIPDVCDYQDIVALPGEEVAVLSAAAVHLKSEGVTHLDLQTLRPDALALKALRTLSTDGAFALEVFPLGVTYETPLPQHWDAYLMQLNGKQRHEVRRKIRRLEEQGPYSYRMAARDDNLERATETFLRLFQLNRADKAEFMSDVMAAYFRELIGHLSRERMLRLFFLEVDHTPVATVFCFDYGGVRYLYNSGYDARFQHLSVGVLSKIFSIQKAVESGCRKYDFLKGAEEYKKRIGGKAVGLYRCLVEL